jgi:hypothetical protein
MYVYMMVEGAKTLLSEEIPYSFFRIVVRLCYGNPNLLYKNAADIPSTAFYLRNLFSVTCILT